MAKIKIIVIFIAALFLPYFAFATDFTSDNFKVKDSVIDSGGVVNSSSDSFKLTGVISQIAIGTSSGSTLQVKSGFLYYSAAAAAVAATAPTPQAPGGNFSMYLENLAKSALLQLPLQKIKPCDITFDFNCDNKVDLKDLSTFLTITPLMPANRTEFNKNLSTFLYYWTSPVFSFFEKQTSQSVAPEISQFKTPSFFKENVAAIFSLKKESVATPSAPRSAPLVGGEKPSIVKTAVKFIQNIFDRFIKLFIKRASAAEQAALFFNPGSGTFLVGSTFNLSIVLDTKGQSVNTAEIEILFPPDKIQLANPSVGQSIIQLWPAPPSFSNREGRIYFVGGIPSPGIITSDGVILALTFRVIAPGDAEVKFGGNTSILANDGRGTDILGQKPSAFFRFLTPPPQGPSISSPTHPDQERWYRDNNPNFIWSKPPFATGFSYSIDHDPSGLPDTISEGPVSTASFNNLDNGIWYFHLRAGSDNSWGGVSTYVVKIDDEPPAAYRVNVSTGTRTTNKNPIFRFFTTDALSGFDHFEMKIISLSAPLINEVFFFEVTSPYQAPNFNTGRYQVIFRAVDKAGNTKDEAVTMNIISSFAQFINPDGLDLVFIFLTWPVVMSVIGFIFIIIAVILLLLWIRHRAHLKHAFWEDIEKAYLFFKDFKNKFKNIYFLLLIFGFVFVFGSSNTVFSEITAPTISVAPTEFYPLDEALYIEGKGPAYNKIEILFEKTDGSANPIHLTASSNSNGEWFVAQKLELSSGEWYVRARSSGSSLSDWSNPRIIRSVVSGFVIGGIKIKYLPIVITLIILFLGAILLLVYSLLKVRRIRHLEIETEIKEKTENFEKKLAEKERESVKTAIEQNFSDIHRKISEELEHLNTKAKSGHILSNEEEEHRTALLRGLSEAEESIEKKIKDVS